MRIYIGIEIEYMFFYCFKGIGNKYIYLCLMNEMKGFMYIVIEFGKKVDELSILNYCFYKNIDFI